MRARLYDADRRRWIEAELEGDVPLSAVEVELAKLGVLGPGEAAAVGLFDGRRVVYVPAATLGQLVEWGRRRGMPPAFSRAPIYGRSA